MSETIAPELFTVPQAARRLGIDPRRLRAAIRSGQLAAYQPGDRTLYIRWSELLHWLREQRHRSADHARERAAEIIAVDEQAELVGQRSERPPGWKS